MTCNVKQDKMSNGCFQFQSQHMRKNRFQWLKLNCYQRKAVKGRCMMGDILNVNHGLRNCFLIYIKVKGSMRKHLSFYDKNNSQRIWYSLLLSKAELFHVKCAPIDPVADRLSPLYTVCTIGYQVLSTSPSFHMGKR